MRKFVAVLFVVFAASVFAFSSVAQRRGRNRGRNASAAIPESAQIAQELGGIQWGWTHEQVVDYFRRALTARYQPLLRNKGQVEQDRLMSERDRQVQQLRDSYIELNGQQNQRRWDTSFIGSEYTHGNGESMLLSEDVENGTREFFFFFNDRLWKRVQARNPPRGLDYAGFVSRIETLFGAGLHINDSEHPDQLSTAVWQDENTRLHLVNNATFFNVYELVYEEKSTLARLTELRHNAPTKQARTAQNVAIDQPAVGNIAGDQNTDIVDRITGKIRNSPTAASNGQGRGSTGGGSGTGTNGSTPSSNGSGSGAQTPSGTTNSSNEGGGAENDPLRGL